MRNTKIFSSIALALSLTVFSPKLVAKAENAQLPKINGKAAITMDLGTGEIVYTQNIDNKMYPASTTKLMTALLLAENKQKEDSLKYTESAKAQPEYSLNKSLKSIAVGETMSASDTMKALLLYSANDSAYMIADNVAGSSDKFITMMNEKAKALGLNNTNFVTANGLHDQNHYTTAYDLALLGKAAYANPWVKETMALKKETIRTSAGTILIIENRNKLLGKDGNVGGKTGSTSQAGKNLVAIYNRDGREMAGVVLGSVYDRDDTFVFNDMEQIINWSYNAKRVPLYTKNSVVDTLPIKYKLFKFFGPEKTIDVPFLVKQDVEYYENDVNKKEITPKIDTENVNPWNLSKDNKAATLTVAQRNSSQSYDLYPNISKTDILKSNAVVYILSSVGFIVILALIAFTIAALRRLSRKKKRYF